MSVTRGVVGSLATSEQETAGMVVKRRKGSAGRLDTSIIHRYDVPWFASVVYIVGDSLNLVLTRNPSFSLL